MDATRRRRMRDQARSRWYAGHRQRRFARHMGFAAPTPAPDSLPGGRGEHLLAEAVASQQLMLRAG
jgi:hypothetical protein